MYTSIGTADKISGNLTFILAKGPKKTFIILIPSLFFFMILLLLTKTMFSIAKIIPNAYITTSTPSDILASVMLESQDD